jgi:fumarate hydratase class II
MAEYRIERDSMGEVRVPANAYYGAQTQRALLNFPISDIRFSRPFIRALGLIKKAAAETNRELGALDPAIANAIALAADDVIDGKMDQEFAIDIFQTGSGTSTNMNANEVIANRAIELRGGLLGSREIHPNDHVNLGQSSNDVIPTALHVAAMEEIDGLMLPAIQELREALAEKAQEFDHIVKIGRTHLQDAVPIRLGQEFSGFESMMAHGIRRIRAARNHLIELAIGGTAVGTGLNCPEGFPAKVVAKISDWTGIEFREAENRFESLAGRDAAVEASGMLKTLAVSLMKIANDLRWLGSGPRGGIGELRIPPTQPGSSIMPGKVNPVIAESAAMAAAQVIGSDVAITVGGQSGNFELNVMIPVIAHNLLQSIKLLSNVSSNLADKCVRGLQVDLDRTGEHLEKSLALVTALVPLIGYDRAAEIAKEAYRSGRTIRAVCLEKRVLPEAELNQVLEARHMTGK